MSYLNTETETTVEAFKWNGSKDIEIFPPWIKQMINSGQVNFASNHPQYGDVIEFSVWNEYWEEYSIFTVGHDEWIVLDDHRLETYSNTRFIERFVEV